MNMLAFIMHWNVAPEIVSFELFGREFALRWYSLLFGLAFLLGYQIFVYIFRNEKKDESHLDDLLMYMFIAVVVGARLGHVIFYGTQDGHGVNPYFENPIEILKVWEGGLASHGAIFSILPAMYLFTRKHKGYSYMWLMDRICWVVALAAFLIRLGNFFNSEIVGLPTDGSWGIIFDRNLMPNGMPEIFPRVPIMLFESISYLMVFLLISFIYVKTKGQFREGLIFGLFFTLMLALRFIWEIWKDDVIVWGGMNNGQLLSIPFFLFGLAILAYVYLKPSNSKA